MNPPRPWIVWITEASHTYPSGARYFPGDHGYGFGEPTLNEARNEADRAASRAFPHWETMRVEIRRYCDACGATGRVKGNRKCKACGTNGSTPVETAIFKRLNP
jgi:hypothetical protein